LSPPLTLSPPGCLVGRGLPTIFVETEERALKKVLASKENKARAEVVAVSPEGEETFTGVCSLRGRGNSTFACAKRPFNLNFSHRVSLTLDGDSARQWCLLANYADESQLHNAICFHVANTVGIPYTCRPEFVSLYVNGEYQGLYNLATKDACLGQGGGEIACVFERTREERQHDATTPRGFCLRRRLGDRDSILRAVEAFEEALYSDTVSCEGLERYIDVGSLLRKCFVDEVCTNGDLSFSQYFTIDSEGRIAAACAWDYDLSFGTWYYPDLSYNTVVRTFPWYNALFERDDFRQGLLDMLSEYEDLLSASFPALTDSLCRLVGEDWRMNALRWRNAPPAWDGDSKLKAEGYDFGTLEGNKAYLDDFMARRYAFLRDYWQHPDEYCLLWFKHSLSGVTVACRKGERLTEDMLADGLLSMPEEGFEGWRNEEGVLLADVGEVWHDMTFEELCSPEAQPSSPKLLTPKRLLLVALLLVLALSLAIALRLSCLKVN
ncbi:MAG: CotH kinase family protein, partial [Prevotellaceae bacterium]|nr:CotH kinase family protein [Prevotellaceae bacterium]